MSFSGLSVRKFIAVAALAFACAVSIFGGMIYENESKYSSILFKVLGVFYMPGLTVAAVVGGALRIGNIHDPSLVVAGIVNVLLYGWGAFFTLKNAFRPKNKDRLDG